MTEQRRPRLEGKVAIVTGAGSSGPGTGTGKAMSMLFAREGARVLLVDREARRAEETLAAIREEAGEASVFEGDVTVASDCQRMTEAAVERYGGLHILVNNVGIFLAPSSVTDVDEEEWDRVLNVNLKSMMLTSKYVIPGMVNGGSIINISSIGGLRGSVGSRVAYNTSKGGAVALTTSMAVQHGRDNIRVNCIVPGAIKTPMALSQFTEETLVRNRAIAPLGTEGTAWDVAWAAVFLASDESRWITGITLPVDAGWLATSPGGMPQDY